MITHHSVQIDVIGELRSKRDRNFPLQAALLELIDNSVDEGATVITIREAEGDLVIEDNGTGFEDIASALIVAKSKKKGKIGRYGVGMKDACLKYSKTTVIESNGKRFTAPWEKMIKQEISNLVEEEDIEHDPTTRIVLCGFRQKYTRAIETKDIRRTYQKLIEDGLLQITVTGTELGRLDVPDYTETLEEVFEYEGKLIRLYGGIYKSNDPARQDWKGYNPYYNGRLIGNGKITTYGTGDEGCTNFCFMLELLDDLEPWGLSTNKDDVEGMEELLDYIYHQYTQPMLKRGSSQASEIELKELEENINRQLTGGGNITRTKPQKTKPAGKPADPGPKKMRTNSATGPGRYHSKSGSARLMFQFAHIGGESLGEIQNQGKRVIITANLDNPFIAQNKTNEPLILCMAKFAYAMQSQISKADFAADEYVTNIMTQAGEELGFTADSSRT